MENKNNEINKTNPFYERKTSITKHLVFTIFLVLICSSFVFASDKSDLVDVLDNYYQASIDEDLDAYMNTLDTSFTDLIMENEGDYREYVRGTFESLNIKSYKINDPSFKEVNDNSAFLFYNLNSEVESEDGTKQVSIDNDMVAFFWKYDGEWKVRWTITSVMFEQKMISEVIYASAAQMTIDETGKTLKEEAVELGFIDDDKDITEDMMQEDDSGIILKDNYPKYEDLYGIPENFEDLLKDGDDSSANAIDKQTENQDLDDESVDGHSDTKSSDLGGLDSEDKNSSEFNQEEFEEYYNKHYSDDSGGDGFGLLTWIIIFIVIIAAIYWVVKKRGKK